MDRGVDKRKVTPVGGRGLLHISAKETRGLQAKVDQREGIHGLGAGNTL